MKTIKTIRNPEPAQIEIEDINGQKKVLTIQAVSVKGLISLDEQLNKSGDNNFVRMQIKMAAYYGGIPADYENLNPGVLSGAIQYAQEVMFNPPEA